MASFLLREGHWLPTERTVVVALDPLTNALQMVEVLARSQERNQLDLLQTDRTGLSSPVVSDHIAQILLSQHLIHSVFTLLLLGTLLSHNSQNPENPKQNVEGKLEESPDSFGCIDHTAREFLDNRVGAVNPKRALLPPSESENFIARLELILRDELRNGGVSIYLGPSIVFSLFTEVSIEIDVSSSWDIGFLS